MNDKKEKILYEQVIDTFDDMLDVLMNQLILEEGKNKVKDFIFLQHEFNF